MREQAIDPGLPIIGAHHHIWPATPHPQFETYLVEAVLADKTGSGHDIVVTVFVEANACDRMDGPEMLWPVGETEFARPIA